MHNQSKNTKATNKKKKNFVFCFFYDVMMTSSHHYSFSPPAEHDLVLEKKKKNFSAQNFTHFQSKIHRFPSSNINSSIQTQKLHKKRIIARTKQALIFEIPPNKLQKSNKMMGFDPNNILYKFPTTIGLKNRESTSNKK